MAKNPQPARTPVKKMGTAKVSSVRGVMPERYFSDIANNTSLQPCCRDVDPSEVELFDTDGNGVADLMVITCDVCGRKQYRGAAGAKGSDGKLIGV